MTGENVNEEAVRENLNNVMETLKFTPNAFSKWLGVDSSNLLKKLKGTIKITSKDFKKYSAAKINVEYLLTGKGDMFTGPVSVFGTEIELKPKGIPIYEEEFACGFLDFNDSALTPIGYADLPGTKKATCWCKATGDSMQPLINNGDYVCLQKVEDWKDFLILGDVYAIDAKNDMRTIKRIDKGESDNEFTLVPTNEGYSSQPIKKSMIRNLFRVLAVTKIL